jgi:type II secretory pathway component PulF
MTPYFAIAYVMMVVQVSLGVAMIATTSVAANRRLNTPHRAVDVAFYVLGCASFALGIWGLIMLAAVVAFHGSSTNEASFVYVTVLLYSVPLIFGGLLQARVARSLMTPPPIEQQRKDEWRISLLRAMGWTLTLMPIGMPLGIFVGAYFAIAALFGGSMRVQQESLLLILAIAVRTQAPLSEEIDLLADSSRGRFRRRLRELASQLRGGTRLSDALEDLPGLVPPRTVTAIRVGEDLGHIVPVIEQEVILLRRREKSRVEGRYSAAGIGFYVWCVLCVVLGVVGFLSFVIVPKLQQILHDFGVQVPTATARLLHVIEACTEHWEAILVWTLVLVGGMVFVLIRRGGWGGIDWGVFSTIYPRLETPGVLRSLSQAVAARRPLAAALTGLELHHRRRHVRNRIRRVRDALMRGGDCFQQLCRHGLISAREAAALVSAEKTGNLAWTLEGLADNIESRKRAREQVIIETVQPAVVIGLGLIIFSVCVAMFIPLIHILGSAELW